MANQCNLMPRILVEYSVPMDYLLTSTTSAAAPELFYSARLFHVIGVV